jgi:hypothetical protein
MFWNDECKEMSDQLWIPSLEITHHPEQKNYFRCENKNISFNYYADKDAFLPDIEFQEIELPDNTLKKNKLYMKLQQRTKTI